MARMLCIAVCLALSLCLVLASGGGGGKKSKGGSYHAYVPPRKVIILQAGPSVTYPWVGHCGPKGKCKHIPKLNRPPFPSLLPPAEPLQAYAAAAPAAYPAPTLVYHSPVVYEVPYSAPAAPPQAPSYAPAEPAYEAPAPVAYSQPAPVAPVYSQPDPISYDSAPVYPVPQSVSYEAPAPAPVYDVPVPQVAYTPEEPTYETAPAYESSNVAFSAPAPPQDIEQISYEAVAPLAPPPPPQEYSAPVAPSPSYSESAATYAAEPAYIEQESPSVGFAAVLPEQQQVNYAEPTWAPAPSAFDIAPPVQQEVEQSYGSFDAQPQEPQYESPVPTAYAPQEEQQQQQQQQSFDPYQPQQEIQQVPFEEEFQQYPDANNYGNRIRPRGALGQDRQF